MFRYFGFSFISYLHFWFCSLARFLDREHGPVVLGAWVLGRHDIDDGREFGRFAFAFWHWWVVARSAVYIRIDRMLLP